MKIAIDCHTLEIKDWAGKEQYLFNLIKTLAKLDVENDYILYFRRPVNIKKSFILPNSWEIKNIKLPTPLWQFFLLFRMVFLDKINFLLVPCTYLLPAINRIIPMGIIVHDLTTFLPGIKNTHKLTTVLRERLVLSQALKNSLIIFTVSENTKKDLIEMFPLDGKNITTIYAAPQFFSDNIHPEKILSKFNIPKDYILFTGTLEPRKNIVGLIRSFSIIKDKIPSYKLVVAGKKGWHFDEIFKTAKELNIEDRIIFTGYVSTEDLSSLYKKASCFVYISFYEGFGMPPVEAMAFGLPVIVSNNSSLSEIVDNGGLLVNPKNHEEISQAIMKVLLDDNLKNELRHKAKFRASKFTWEKTVKSFLGSIDRLVK